MAATKAQCLTIQREMACEKSANYDQPQCAQCYTDTSYKIVDPAMTKGLIAGSGTVYIVGNCTLSFVESGFQTLENIQLSTSSPKIITLLGGEMTRISMIVRIPSGMTSIPYIAGYLSGTTKSGTFTIDLYRTIQTDSMTGRKPRTTGGASLDGVDVTRMSPGFGQTRMELVAGSPFSFITNFTKESDVCPSSPYVTTKAGAELLGNDPCFVKGAGPGKYSTGCLQNIFLTNGCTSTGKGYPSNMLTASNLMMNPDGSFRSINDIANYVYSQAIITTTGLDANGNELPIPEWSASSVFCTGAVVATPCDTPAKEAGPLLPECLAYLWNNMGAKNTLGSSYNVFSMATSILNDPSNIRFCTTSGTLSPVGSDGKKNKDAIAYWQKVGGVIAVKAAMRSIHNFANSTGMQDNERITYINQCYGNIQLAPRPRPEGSSRAVNLMVPAASTAFEPLRRVSPGPPPPPSSLILWLDAKDPLATGAPVANGTAITRWSDKSSGKNDAVAIGNPILQSGAVQLNLKQQFATQVRDNPQYESVFVVVSLLTNQPHTVANILPNNYQNGRQFWLTPNGFRFGRGGVNTIVNGKTAPALGAGILYSYIYNNTSITTFYNGVDDGIGSCDGTISWGPPYKTVIGGAAWTQVNATVGSTAVFSISEILVYKSVLPQGERQNIEGYLAWKWGLEKNLPRNHPHASSSPFWYTPS
jgi:hypothetical protein